MSCGKERRSTRIRKQREVFARKKRNGWRQKGDEVTLYNGGGERVLAVTLPGVSGAA